MGVHCEDIVVMISLSIFLIKSRSFGRLWHGNVVKTRVGRARSLRGLCENKNFSSCTPARRETLVRNGLPSLPRNITARPCVTLFPPNLTAPKGGATTLKKGGRASLLGLVN